MSTERLQLHRVSTELSTWFPTTDISEITVCSTQANLLNVLLLELGGREGCKYSGLFEIYRRCEASDCDAISKKVVFILKRYLSLKPCIEAALVSGQMRESGLPVPPTTRFFSLEDSSHRLFHYLLMTNLTYGNRYLVWGKSASMTREQNKDLKRMNLSSDDIAFLAVAVEEVAVQAAQAGHLLGQDNFHIRRECSTQQLDVVLLDPNQMNRRQSPYPNLENVNKAQATNFIKDLKMELLCSS